MESRGTYREVTANKPDIIIKSKKEKTHVLIDVAIPAERNVTQKEAEKELKYESLCIEIQHMWNMKCMIDYTPGNWSDRNNNKRFKEIRSHTRKTFSILATEDSYTENITNNM
jgi:hypothetical protein